jgi:hypothetical protein
VTIDTAKAARWMKRERKMLDNWLARAGTADQMRATIADYATGKQHYGSAAVALELLGNYHGAAGCVRVLGGDDGGFAELDLACVYNYWTLRMITRAYDLDTRPEKQARVLMDAVATCWMHAEAIGAVEIRDWLNALIESVNAGNGSVGGKDMNALCALAAHFATGGKVGKGWAKLGPYQPVANGSLTSEGYDDLAVHHTGSVDGSGFPAFPHYPYRLAPLELLAIEKRTGVPIGERAHPLLRTPLAKRRQASVDLLPPEIQSAIERARGELGF